MHSVISRDQQRARQVASPVTGEVGYLSRHTLETTCSSQVRVIDLSAQAGMTLPLAEVSFLRDGVGKKDVSVSNQGSTKQMWCALSKARKIRQFYDLPVWLLYSSVLVCIEMTLAVYYCKHDHRLLSRVLVVPCGLRINESLIFRRADG